jgi:hypothetical protein
MGELDYVVEPEVECPDNDPNDVAFVRVTVTIDDCDAIKEYTPSHNYQSSPAENLVKAQAGQGLQKEVIKTHGKNCKIEVQKLTRRRRRWGRRFPHSRSW